MRVLKIFFWIVPLVTLSITLCATPSFAVSDQSAISKTLIDKNQDYFVKRVIDVDSLELTNGTIIKLIGVSVPSDEKTRQLAKQTMEYYLGLSLTMMSNAIRIQLDRSRGNAPNQENITKAYVFCPAYKDMMLNSDGFLSGEMSGFLAKTYQVVYGREGLFLNASLIRAGLAKVDRSIDFEFKHDLFMFEDEARHDEEYIWSNNREERLRNTLERLIKEYPKSKFKLPSEKELYTPLYGFLPDDYKIFLLRAGDIDLNPVELARVTKDAGGSYLEKMFSIFPINPETDIVIAKNKKGVFLIDRASVGGRKIKYCEGPGNLKKTWPDIASWIEDYFLQQKKVPGAERTGSKS